MFDAILLNREADATHAAVASIDEAQWAAGDVDVRIDYSTLNYKDALAITGRGAVVRAWPMVPGIDLAGRVERSAHPDWQPGDEVVVTGHGLGETHWGGLAQKARLDASWLLRRPAAFSARQAMALGTAGFTAALSVLALQRHGVAPSDGEVLVTGASGGVGSVAVMLLARLGFTVAASTGRPHEAEHLRGLGAARIVERAHLAAPGKPLQAEQWAAVVDSVGSHTLVNACAATRAHGAVTACGLAQGADFPGTVLPFILRGVALYGIHSVDAAPATRARAWALLAERVDREQLDAQTGEIALRDAIAAAADLLDGRLHGRVVVNVQR